LIEICLQEPRPRETGVFGDPVCTGCAVLPVKPRAAQRLRRRRRVKARVA
jgi:hypothetical protein